MKTAIESFHNNIKRVHDLTEAYTILVNCEPTKDFSDVLRAQYVLAISALDMFIHDIIRAGMVEILQGNRKQTEEYQKFSITMSLINFDERYGWFESEVRRRLGKETYQNPYQIFEGMKLVFDDKPKSMRDSRLWKEVAEKIGKNSREITDTLDAIVQRRNKIVHEADIKPTPTMPGILWEIEAATVTEMIDFIEKIVEAIYNVLRTSDKNMYHIG